MTEHKKTPALSEIRRPIAMILDSSASAEAFQDDLRNYGKEFIERLRANPLLAESVDLLIVRFNHDVDLTASFSRVKDLDPETAFAITPSGCTDPGNAILFTLGKLDQHKQMYKDSKLPYRQPVLYLLTDGVPDAGIGASEKECEAVKLHYHEAARCVHDLEQKEALTFIGVGLGAADLEKIADLTTEDYVGMLDSLPLETFFDLAFDATRTGTPWTGIFDAEEFI